MSSRLRCDVSPSPQTPYLVGTALSAVGGRSVCLTPRCSSRNWKGSTPPINSSPRTKGGGYPRRRTWQRDKWQSGFRTDAWRRRRWWTNSRAPVSSGELREGGGGGETWMRLHPRKLCYNLLRCMDGFSVARAALLVCSEPTRFLPRVLIGTSRCGLSTEGRKWSQMSLSGCLFYSIQPRKLNLKAPESFTIIDAVVKQT